MWPKWVQPFQDIGDIKDGDSVDDNDDTIELKQKTNNYSCR